MLEPRDQLVTNAKKNWGHGPFQWNRKSLGLQMAGVTRHYTESDRDTLLMASFLKNSSLDKAVFPGPLGRKEYIPAGIPILDIIRAQLEKSDSWKFPSKSTLDLWSSSRGMSLDMLNIVEVKEIVIGISSEDEIQSTVEWAQKMIDTNQESFPTGVVAFRAKEMSMTTYDKLRLNRMEYDGNYIKLESTPGPAKEGELSWLPRKDGKVIRNIEERFPVKTLLGDGISWLLVISFGFKSNKKEKYIKSSTIPETLVQFMETLPPLVGFSAREDAILVESTFSTLLRREFRFPRIIELGTMAVFSGWRLEVRSRVALSLICLGTPLNRLSTTGDKSWFKEFSDITPELKIFLIMDIKFVYLCYNIFLICTREEVLPDPEISCHLVGCHQWETTKWWSGLINRVVSGVWVDSGTFRASSTRAEMFQSLRARNPSGQLQHQPPYRVQVASKMFEGGITVTRGGNRFLHIERERILKTIQYAAKLPVPGYQHIFEGKITEAHMLYARFGQYGISKLDASIPVPRTTTNKSLVYHPNLPLPEVILNTSELSIEYLLRIFKELKRSHREGLLEWGRLNPEAVNKFFRVCIRDINFSKKYRSLYEPLRLIVLYVQEEFAIEVPACETNIIKYQDEELHHVEAENAAIQTEVDALLARKSESDEKLRLLRAAIDAGKWSDRSRWKGPDQPVRLAENIRREESRDRRRRPVSVRRRGSSPEERRREQEPLPRVELPVNVGEGPWWKDQGEDRSGGHSGFRYSKTRVQSATPSEASDSDSPKVVEEHVVEPVPDEIRVVRMINLEDDDGELALVVECEEMDF